MSRVKLSSHCTALLDPDEFFLEPLIQGKPKEKLLSQWPPRMKDKITDIVKPGMAVAQMYGFGTVWLNMFKKETLCPGITRCWLSVIFACMFR